MQNLVIFICVTAALLVVLAGYLVISDIVNRHARSRELRRQGRLREIANREAKSAAARESYAAETWSDKWQIWFEQSGLKISPLLIILSAIAMGSVIAGTTYVVTRSIIWSSIAFVVLAAVPFGIVAMLRHRRCNRIREQLPDALDLMSRMLRAGQSIPQAIQGVADEFEEPIAEEFGFCYEQQNLGLSTDASMEEMAKRTGVLELRILVVALTVHRQSGGNLADLLDNLASVVRDRYRIQGQIRALTADGRLQAAVLLALPPFLLVVLSALNSEYVEILLRYPWLLGGMFGFELLGALWLRRIVQFDF